LRKFFRAKNKAGLTVPWLYTRSLLARWWGILPMQVDAMPDWEIALQIKLWEIEDESKSG
jgi:hypothetical protein